MVVTAGPPAAATYTVDDTTDAAANASDCTTPVPGACSFRDAVAAATSASGDVIVLHAGTTYGLDCPGRLGVVHPSGTPLTIQGNGATLAMGGQVPCGGTLTLAFQDKGPLTQIFDTTFTGGTEGSVSGTDVRLTRSTVTGNTGDFALYADTNVDLHQSTVSDNPNNNGIVSDGTALVVDSTISGNSAGVVRPQGSACDEGAVDDTSCGDPYAALHRLSRLSPAEPHPREPRPPARCLARAPRPQGARTPRVRRSGPRRVGPRAGSRAPRR